MLVIPGTITTASFLSGRGHPQVPVRLLCFQKSRFHTPLTPIATGKPLCFSTVWIPSPLTWWTTEAACHGPDLSHRHIIFRLCRRILLSLDINVLTWKKKRSIHIKTQAIHFSGRIGNSGNTGYLPVAAVFYSGLSLWGAGQVLSRPPSSLLALLFMPYLPTGWNKVFTSSAWWAPQVVILSPEISQHSHLGYIAFTFYWNY